MSDVLSASITVEINGVLAITQYTLDYTNGGSTPVEAIYHFTLPRMASLMACEVSINDRHYVAQIKASNEAIQDYETALQRNKRAVLIESLNDGLYAINIGNLDVDETIVITLSIAQLLQSEAGGNALTYRLPTTIAPRFGGTGNHVEPEYDKLAHYPFTATVNSPDLDVISSSHSTYVDKGVTCFRGALDRDVFFTFRAAFSGELYRGSYGGKAYAVGYSNPPQASDLPVLSNLHCVVDRSGSMAGAAIALCKTGLHRLLQALGPSAKVNLTGFGSQHETLFPEPTPLDGASQRKLRQYIGLMTSDMGGTELTRTLLSALDALPSSGEVNHLMLITDGQVHLREEDFAAISLLCHRTGTHLHTIGVGYSVNEQLIYRLANDNDGVCSVVNPNGELTDTISMLANVVNHAPLVTNHNVLAGTSWSATPKKAYAGFPQPIFAELDEYGAPEFTELSGDWAKAAVHLCAIRQMWELDAASSRQLATSLGILTKHTAFVMVDTEGDPLKGDMQTRVLAQMLPPSMNDGFMFCKSVDANEAEVENYLGGSPFSAHESSDAPYTPRQNPAAEYLDIPAFLRQQEDKPSIFESAELLLLSELGKVLWRSGRWTKLYLKQVGLNDYILGQLESLADGHKVTLASLALVYLGAYCTLNSEHVNPRARKRLNRARDGMEAEVIAKIDALLEGLTSESST